MQSSVRWLVAVARAQRPPLHHTTQTGSPSFSLQVLPSSVTLTAGGASQILTVGASPVNNFSGSVAIKLGSLPAGVTATPSSLSVAVGSMGQFTLSAAASSQPAHVDLPVSASAGEIQQSAKASLTIDQAVTQPTITTVSLSTLAFDFGDNLVGNALTKTAVTVTNTGSAALTLNPTVSGDTSFVLATGSAATSSSCGQQLAPAASCNVVLVYTPAKASTPSVQTAKLNLGMGGVAAGTQQERSDLRDCTMRFRSASHVDKQSAGGPIHPHVAFRRKRQRELRD